MLWPPRWRQAQGRGRECVDRARARAWNADRQVRDHGRDLRRAARHSRAGAGRRGSFRRREAPDDHCRGGVDRARAAGAVEPVACRRRRKARRWPSGDRLGRRRGGTGRRDRLGRPPPTAPGLPGGRPSLCRVARDRCRPRPGTSAPYLDGGQRRCGAARLLGRGLGRTRATARTPRSPLQLAGRARASMGPSRGAKAETDAKGRAVLGRSAALPARHGSHVRATPAAAGLPAGRHRRRVAVAVRRPWCRALARSRTRPRARVEQRAVPAI